MLESAVHSSLFHHKVSVCDGSSIRVSLQDCLPELSNQILDLLLVLGIDRSFAVSLEEFIFITFHDVTHTRSGIVSFFSSEPDDRPRKDQHISLVAISSTHNMYAELSGPRAGLSCSW